MPKLFDINAPSNTIFIDENRRGEAVVVITNSTEKKLQGRVLIEGSAKDLQKIVQVLDGERTFLPKEAQQFTIRVEIPKDSAGGEYQFRVAVLDVDTPDETYQLGSEILFNAPYPVQIGSTAAAIIGMIFLLLVVIAGLVGLIYILTQEQENTGIDSQIAFSTVRNGQQVIMLYDLRRDATNPLSQMPIEDSRNYQYPRWSPEGRRLGFISNRGTVRSETGNRETWSLFIYTPVDGQIRRIDEDIANVISFAWSPDGERIVYQRRNAADAYELVQIEANGDAPLVLYESSTELFSLDYYPDGRGLTFVENNLLQYYLFSSDTVTPLIPIEMQGSLFGYPLEMAWSASGDVLAIAAMPDLSNRRFVSIYRLDFVELSDTELAPVEESLLRLTFGHNDRSPLWTEDGERILFISTTRNSESYLPEVYSILARADSIANDINLPVPLAVFEPDLQPNVGGELEPTATPTLTPTPTVTPSPTPTETATP